MTCFKKRKLRVSVADLTTTGVTDVINVTDVTSFIVVTVTKSWASVHSLSVVVVGNFGHYLSRLTKKELGRLTYLQAELKDTERHK